MWCTNQISQSEDFSLREHDEVQGMRMWHLSDKLLTPEPASLLAAAVLIHSIRIY